MVDEKKNCENQYVNETWVQRDGCPAKRAKRLGPFERYPFPQAGSVEGMAAAKICCAEKKKF